MSYHHFRNLPLLVEKSIFQSQTNSKTVEQDSFQTESLSQQAIQLLLLKVLLLLLFFLSDCFFLLVRILLPEYMVRLVTSQSSDAFAEKFNQEDAMTSTTPAEFPWNSVMRKTLYDHIDSVLLSFSLLFTILES